MSLERGKRRKFLLLEECYGKKITDDNRPTSLFNKSALETEVQLVPGSILQEVKSEPGSPSLCVQSLDHDNVYMLCNNTDVHELSPFEAEVLVPVSPVRDRLRVLSDDDWLKEAEMIVEGSNVNVDLGADLDPVEGIVRYCGVVPELGKGIVFGIELLVHPEHGVCDGSIKGKRYFQCASNNAIFVGINRLRLHLRGYKYTQSGNIVEHADHRERDGTGGALPSSKPHPLSLEAACADGTPPPPLQLGDRVVWISDSGPEYGEVKWLGKLLDVGTDWMVGVEFDNPVGTGTGKYNDHQLFEAKLNHASLVPIIGLMKADDFLGGEKLRMSLLAGSSFGTLPKSCRRKKSGESSGSVFVERVALGVSTNQKLGITRLDDSTSSMASASTVSRKSSANYVARHSSQDGADLEVGSVVEVLINNSPCYGVIRWIGEIPEARGKLVAGIEMEEESSSCTDGTFNGKRYFTCSPRKAFFVRLSHCRKDSRFLESEKRKSAVFGSIDCPSITGDVPPLSSPEDMKLLYGKNKGIQGHHNSCYLDATLFAMFSCTGVFDSILHRPKNSDDIAEYDEVQRVLKEEIVNPLRANFYVRADRVMELRKRLERLSSVRGLTSEEKDPEEFLNSLLNQILRAEPFLKLSSGQESYFYQLFVEKDEKLVLPTVQQLFDQSFLASDIKLTEVPPCLLIQMPRFGKQFKMYPRIIPSQYLDITDVLEDSPRQCSICGQVAEYECKECYGQFGEGLDSIAFCQKCMDKSHSHKKRTRHHSVKLSVPPEFRMLKDHTPVPRIYMELFAVVCIETSHYVCFVKCGSGPDAPWCFFDSMADRKGEQNGYNIPEVVPFADLRWWLSEEGMNFLLSAKDDKVLPEITRRLLCDAYMCMYQSPDVMMYR
ncbi:ubiquitin carboxyl-terminal hydrolase CYLD-like isoform X3 [Argiope bruennichi]|uniref:ubiquitin carboxyl-terminal hydrolase CYLD-like isoform X3 n=1 Tax=Argiope bruennichi TaxID=94029 RepID=UPI0024946771|nr:ubiquitin carboxyl-terminal hydrolase CYLD-like isoform X3 [Argiope bruennichi]